MTGRVKKRRGREKKRLLLFVELREKNKLPRKKKGGECRVSWGQHSSVHIRGQRKGDGGEASHFLYPDIPTKKKKMGFLRCLG